MAVPALFLKEGAKGAARVAKDEMSSGEVPDLFSKRDADTKKKPPKGAHWTNPLQEQHPDVNRFFLMNFESATPETMGRALAKDFEVKHRGGLNFSIRKPGEKKWRVVDPDTWSDWIPFWGGDWSDVVGDLFVGITSGIGGTIGAGLGAGAGTAVAPGAGTAAGSLKGAAGGAAIGAGIGEAAKQAVGKLLGSGVTAGEAAESIGTEAVLGGVSEPIARVAGPAIKSGIGKAKTALLGNTAEVAAKNDELLKQYMREVGQGAEGLAEPEMLRATEGVLPAISRRGQKLSDDLLMSEKQSIADLANLERDELTGRALKEGVRTTEDVTPKQILAGSEGNVLKQQAENVRAGKQRIRQAELELSKAEALSTRARSKAERERWKAEIPALRETVRFLRGQAAKEGGLFTGVEIPAKLSHSEAIQLAQKIGKGDPDAIARAAELGVPIEEKSQTALAQDLFEKTATSEQKEAISRQVDEALAGLEPYEDVKLSHVLRNESKETGLPRGAERTETVTDAPRVDPAAYQAVEEELRDLSLEEAQDRLVRSGWEGDVPATKEDVVDALHARREWGVTKGEVPEGFARSEMRRMWSEGPKTKPHSFAKPTVTSIERGGETFVPGQRPSRLADFARAASGPAKTAGSIAQGIGATLEAPMKGVRGVTRKVLGKGLSERVTNYPAMSVATLSLGALGASPVAAMIAGVAGAEMVGSGIHKVGRFLSRDGSGRALIRLISSAPENVARKMMPALEALQNRGIKSYRAGIFSLMHDPEVRYWLEEEVERAQKGSVKITAG